MNSDSGARAALDVRAVGTGLLWGLAVLLAGSAVQGVVGYGTPLSALTEDIMGMVWQAVSAMVGGFLAARRAAGSGWLHGALAGLSLILSIGAVMGVTSTLPTLAAFLKAAGIGAGAGALAGVLGVNSAR